MRVLGFRAPQPIVEKPGRHGGYLGCQSLGGSQILRANELARLTGVGRLQVCREILHDVGFGPLHM